MIGLEKSECFRPVLLLTFTVILRYYSSPLHITCPRTGRGLPAKTVIVSTPQYPNIIKPCVSHNFSFTLFFIAVSFTLFCLALIVNITLINHLSVRGAIRYRGIHGYVMPAYFSVHLLCPSLFLTLCMNDGTW
ncbi:hypothetical protein E2C01_044833 [Portunus trituberculatus]|uniref:Uncharacterized protein n=1 Tax=Portunus trituberculatus TaxID=210409 RepID=A0A5B7G079_PORTR|nr:hypothetical protein [Portunus trituberculatus]